jgi:DNA-binding MarR family transcriptional regulator
MSKQPYTVETYSPGANVGYWLKRTHSLMLDIIEPVLEARGFSFVQYVVMAWLREGIAVNPRELCTRYRHDSGAMTRLIDQLAERGLLERVRGDRDRRKVELNLTDAGRVAVDGLVPLVVANLNRALADFAPEEVQELSRLLLKLTHTLQAAADSAGEAA